LHEDFFYGVQWTKKEIDELTKRGMAPLVVNRTMPVIQQEMSMFLAKRPTFRYFPVDDDADVRVAQIYNDAAQHVWHISNGDSEYQQTMQDYFVMGAGYMQAYIDPYADESRGEVMIKSLPPWDVYPDPNSRNIDLSDARYIIVSRVIDKAALKFMYPNHAEKIDDAPSEAAGSADKPTTLPNTEISSAIAKVDFQSAMEGSDKVRVIERYEKVRVRRYKIFDATRGKTFKTSYLPEGYEDQLKNPESAIRSTEVWDTIVEVHVSVGPDLMLEKYILQMDVYPIISFYLHHRRNPYPVGDVAVIIGMQQETNKRRSIMLHNATLSGNFRMMAPKGSIPNKQDFELRGTTPGYLLEYLEVNGQVPQPLLPAPLSPAWVALEQEAKGDIEYSLSVFSNMMGSNQDAPETYRGLLALEERGQQKIQYKAKHARHGLRMLGIAVMQLIQQSYSPMKVLRVVGETNETIKRSLANDMVMDEFTGRVKSFNDVTVGKYDLIVADGTTMPTNRMAMAQMMQDFYQLGLVDKEEVWKRLDIPDIEELRSRMSEQAQMSSQIAQLQDTLKNLEGLNQTLRRQLQQAEVHLGAQGELEKIKDGNVRTIIAQGAADNQIKQEIAAARASVALTKEKAAAEVALIKARTTDEARLMKMRAELEADIERERAELDARRAVASRNSD